ncbi:helix-turn-helix domain-containing protein [Neobacillus sp. NPDC093127]|uniref:helix-turn-helix domain-containing protein n=1 Tax=Neobacillus sp. NPDC093127 TaxID=3364296 RepID=UPI0037F681C4
MKVKSNLKALLDEREISVRKCSTDIEYRFESVRKMYNDDMEHFPKQLIGKLCTYLQVEPGDIIVSDKDDPDC